MSPANFIAESLINMSRPFMGSILDKFELFGTRRDQWMPRLVKKLPSDQLPVSYGGSNKDFKPVIAYGWIAALPHKHAGYTRSG